LAAADRKLTTQPRAERFAALQAEPPDHGLGSGPKAAAFVTDRLGGEVGPQTGWLWRKDLGFRLIGPRPRHPKAATAEQQRVWLGRAPEPNGRPAA
jgi:hypothetical protein